MRTMNGAKTPRIQRIGNAIICGMLAVGVAAIFGAKLGHPSLAAVLVFFAASWGLLYLLWDWLFIVRPEQVKRNVPITSEERRRRLKRFFDSLPRS